MINKQCNAGDPLETSGGLYRPPSMVIYAGATFDYYECQAVTVVHVVSVHSCQLASARKSFEAGLNGWLSAMYCVRLATVF